MKLIDLKRPKLTEKERKEQATIGPSEENQYPYGSRLSFDKEEIAKIKSLQNIQAGAKVNIQAVGKVIEVRVVDAEGTRKRHNIEIQVQRIAVADQSTYSEAFKEATAQEKS